MLVFVEKIEQVLLICIWILFLKNLQTSGQVRERVHDYSSWLHSMFVN